MEVLLTKLSLNPDPQSSLAASQAPSGRASLARCLETVVPLPAGGLLVFGGEVDDGGEVDGYEQTHEEM